MESKEKQSKTIEKAFEYQRLGFSVIPVKEDKSPACKWKKHQNEMTNDTEINNYFSTNNSIAIVCGHVSGNLEVVDIDTKNDTENIIAQDFFEILKNEFNELYEKLIIAKTINMGYHVFYRCSTIEGNRILAKNKDKNPLIETRGEGGYVLVAPSNGYSFEKGNLKTICNISPEERNIIFNISMSLNRIPEIVKIEQKVFKHPENIFSNYNENVSVSDILLLLQNDGWQQIKEDRNNIFLKRPGKTENTTSATLHKTTKLFYVFTSSSEFTSQRAYNPAQIRQVIEFNNNQSELLKALRTEGFERNHNTKCKSEHTCKKIQSFPLDYFPKIIREFILHCANVYQSSIDYWAGAVISAISLAIGDKMKLDTGKYTNYAIFWICFVGNVSCGKSEPLKQLFQVYRDKDAQSFEKYLSEKKVYDHYHSLSKKERKDLEEPQKPTFFQYIVKDYTPEALYLIHSINNRGMAVYRDELKGFFDDFNRYNKSGEQSNLLEGWYSNSYICNRKGSEPIIIKEPKINIFGTIQPGVLDSISNEHRADTGFTARICFVYPDDDKKSPMSDTKLSSVMMENFNKLIETMLQIPEQITVYLSESANTTYTEWFNANAETSNAESDQYIKGVYGKLDVIALRLSIVIHALNFATDNSDCIPDYISENEMKAAIEITEYFRSTALKVYSKLNEGTKLNQLLSTDVIKYLNQNTQLSQSEIGKILNVSQQYVSKIVKND